MFKQSVWRVSMVGTAYQGQEEWSTGFYVGYEDADAGVPVEADAAAIAARWQTLFTAGNMKIGNSHLTTHIKISDLGTDGKTTLSNTVFYQYPSPIAGAQTNPIPLPQSALVCTLRSSIPRGIASKGRMYLPGVAVPVQGNGHLPTADPENMSTLLKTFFDGVNTDLGIRGDIILASRGRTGANPTTGINAKVTSIRVGDVYDTQRRRRNALQEVYTSKVLTP